MKNMNRNFIIVIIISIVAMGIVLRNDFQDIIHLYTRINLLHLLIPITLMIIYNLVDVLFFKFIFVKEKKDYTFKDALIAQQIGNFVTIIDPFSSTGQLAQTYIFQKQGLSSQKSFSVLMLSFVSYQIVLVVFTVLLLIIDHSYTINNAILVILILGYLINILVITILLLAIFLNNYRNKVIVLVCKIGFKLKLIKDLDKQIKSFQEWFNNFEIEFKKLSKNKKVLAIRSFLDLLKFVIYFSLTYFVALSLNVNPNLDQFMHIFVLSAFAFIVQSIMPIPGSVGGAEASYLSLFYVVFGASTSSIMIIFRLITTYIPMIIGFVIFVKYKKLREVKDFSLNITENKNK